MKLLRYPSAEKEVGFSLIELMVSLAIIALLSSAVLPLTHLNVQRGKEVALKSALRDIRKAIDDYKLAGDEGRIARNIELSGYPPSLEVLAEGVPDLKDVKGKRKIKFIRAIPRDPMQNDASLTNAETWGKRSYASEWDAPQAGEDVYDIYSLSEKTAINGSRYSEW